MKLISILLLLTLPLMADGPKDNIPDNVRQIPKPGIKLKDKDLQYFEAKNKELKNLINQIEAQENSTLTELLPDVKIFYIAIDYALKHHEFLFENDIKKAKFILDEGFKRARSLTQGNAPWLHQKGLVVRGFISKIDESIQPYGLLIPESYDINGNNKFRTDIWLHGRNEKILEISFLHQRMTNTGKFSPADTIVLHPYGRYSNAFKFAGEVDVFEALEHAMKWYRIDAERISNRGFSMGGAGCWQLAVHYTDRFFASNPGAGFSETPDFLKVFQKQELNPTWFEKTLWRLYDCPDYSVNLKQCPTIAYSGENDRQIQAARMMEKGHEKEGMELLHIIGPKMGHKYDSESAKKADQFIAKHAERGLIHVPKSVHFVTYTLKYNKMKWVKIDSLEQHWEKARIDASIDKNLITINTANITAFNLNFKDDQSPFPVGEHIKIIVNGTELTDQIGSNHNKSWKMHFAHLNGSWKMQKNSFSQLKGYKKNNSQGPIDDAFMSRFIFVSPSGQSNNSLFQQWSNAELKRAIKHWRQHFRGDAIVKSDKDVTPEDIATSNLILWGDSSSNLIIKKIADELPIKWNNNQIIAGKSSYSAKDHALIAISPNPLNKEKYVVLNSSFTYREYAYLNNARQVPMLPDWAIIDLKVKPNAIWPGKVVDANFFDEKWQFKPK